MDDEHDIRWIGSSYADLLAFPVEARREAGFQLGKVQAGLNPDDWKPFDAVGAGVREIRIREASGAFRVMYVAKFEDARKEGLKNMEKIDTKVRHVTKRGANLFAELGFPAAEARRLQAESKKQIDQALAVKRQLMDELAVWISANDLKQEDAASILHITRPRVSDVVNHKTSKFTIDALVAMLGRIGKPVRVVVG